jgi:DNA-binding GntR family transcriptional regulator
MKPTDIARESLADRVRQILMERINDGSYPPGTRLIEMQIAGELNISQAPVREAFCALEAARIVETEPYRGTRVRRIGERESREAYQVRAVLEELAVQLGAQRLHQGLAELSVEARDAMAAAKRGDLARYLRHNLRFHQIIVETADNEVLLQTWTSLGSTVGARVRATRTSGDMTAVAQEHLEIVKALDRGDAKRAGRLLRHHAEVLIDNAAAVEKKRDSKVLVNSTAMVQKRSRIPKARLASSSAVNRKLPFAKALVS